VRAPPPPSIPERTTSPRRASPSARLLRQANGLLAPRRAAARRLRSAGGSSSRTSRPERRANHKRTRPSTLAFAPFPVNRLKPLCAWDVEARSAPSTIPQQWCCRVGLYRRCETHAPRRAQAVRWLRCRRPRTLLSVSVAGLIRRRPRSGCGPPPCLSGSAPSDHAAASVVRSTITSDRESSRGDTRSRVRSRAAGPTRRHPVAQRATR